MIQVGDQIPEATFQCIQNSKVENISAHQVFAGKKVVLFAVPGAFTPTCSERHLPGFVALASKIKATGTDIVACTSVNDPFVMQAWSQHHNAEEILMLSDGQGSFAKAIGLDFDTGNFGGIRSRRYLMIIEDLKVTQLQVDNQGEFLNSTAENAYGFCSTQK